MKRKQYLFRMMLTGLFTLSIFTAYADELRVVTTQTSFAIATADGATAIVYDQVQDHEVVGIAATALSGDIKAVTGQTAAVLGTLPAGSTAIIAGTLGRSSLIDALAASGKLSTADINGKWEAYTLQLVDHPLEDIGKALVIAGSTPRGTAYGCFELSRLMGVSPWVWWADVAPEPREALYLSGSSLTVGEPSVKFRGIFINDEDWGIQPWAAKNMDTGIQDIGPRTHERIFELLLRLRANIFWPAMHDCTKAFWYYTENPEVAKRYDIVLGSSHCEPMLRNNVFEWFNEGGNWSNYNWKTNREGVQQYWAKRVEQAKNQDAMYTLGMRGVHDSSIQGYSGTTEVVGALTEILAYQRSLIAEKVGEATTVPQMFCPYNEVLEAYNAGLQVPDDVTLCWCDDNHGYIRQMPTPSEQQRSGSNGIYYHLSYWGWPMDYLWLSTISPSLISYELCSAYEQGVQRLWVINVGDIKPAEEELEFCMDLAWDVDAWQPQQAAGYSRTWAARTFGEDVADEIGAIKREYYRLAAGGKPEHMSLVTYTQDEIDERLSSYADLTERVETVKAMIPDRLQDAYFELVEYPVRCAWLMNVKHLEAKRSFLYAKAGMHDETVEASTKARQAYDEIQTLTTKYNTGIADGKWDGMMNCKPRSLSTFNMPSVASEDDVVATKDNLYRENIIVVPAAAYSAATSTVTAIDGLGLQQQAVCVWPMDLKAYDDASAAPYVEYDVPLEKGLCTIGVRCLPTFPLNDAYDLRYAISIDGAPFTVQSIKTTHRSAAWEPNVLQGWAGAKHAYMSDSKKTVKVRIALLDPGLALSELTVQEPEDTFTDQYIQNADFEYKADGVLNSGGTTVRGVPYGWQTNTVPTGNSYGINNDCKNRHGDNVCWFRATPMPTDLKLYQRVSGLPAGTYRVECRLWAEKDMLGTVRLFANDHVQYFGKKGDYVSNLTEGEVNTFAGHEGTTTQTLSDMYVDVTLADGEQLELGIKTSNQKSDGTRATNQTGWFKCDWFRIRPYTPVAYIVNPGFGSDMEGWTIDYTGTANPKISTVEKPQGSASPLIAAGQKHLQVWGINGQGTISQRVEGLAPGTYRVGVTVCTSGTVSTALFAGDDATPITADGRYTVDATVGADGSLLLGVSFSSSTGATIEVDAFTLEKVDGTTTSLVAPSFTNSAYINRCYSLDGCRLNSPQRGINIVDGRKIVMK